MAQPQVLEGTWEEIKLHDAELIGRQVRVIVAPKKAQTKATNAKSVRAEMQPNKELRGRGMLAGVLNSEEFLRRKHEEKAREDKHLR